MDKDICPFLLYIDIDECEEDAYDCPQFSRCKNQNGSYECPCKDGYRKAPDGTCSGNVLHSVSDFTPRKNFFSTTELR